MTANVFAVALPVNPLADAATKIASGAFDGIAKTLAAAAGEGFAEVTTFWVTSPSAAVDTACSSEALKAASCGASWIQISTSWLAIVVAVAAILFAALKMVLTRSGQPAHDVGRSLVVMILVTGAGLVTIRYLTAAGDAFAADIIARVGKAGFGKDMFTAATISPGFMFILGICGAIVACVQYILLLSRDALLVVFAGVLPLAAAGSSTETGNQWFKRITAWTFAMILYKPVAALIYAAALMQMSGEGSLKTALSGMALMMLAIVALPALMRLVMPAVAAATGSGGGAMAVGAAVASGAVMIGTAGSATPAVAAGAIGTAGATTATAASQAGNSSVPTPPAEPQGDK